MNSNRLYILAFTLLTFNTGCTASKESSLSKGEYNFDGNRKVLFIGIDGCRADAITPEIAPNLTGLIHDGQTAWTLNAVNEAKTISGPNWSTLLTGVHFQKHGVKGNRFISPKFESYPSLFHLLESTYADIATASIVHWQPINREIVGDGSDRRVEEDDAGVAQKAVELLSSGEAIDFLFLHFDDVDKAGHSKGYGTDIETYKDAVSRTDANIGVILAALRARPEYEKEKWLILVTADHGGKGKGHAGGEHIPEIRNVFAILHGKSILNPGKIDEQVRLVDLPVTAMAYMGIGRDYFDGKVIGIELPDVTFKH